MRFSGVNGIILSIGVCWKLIVALRTKEKA